MAAMLGVALLLSGCGQKQTGDIPKLEEPVAINDAYRPVEYGSIGKVEVLFGTVVPKDYCHYYSANVAVSKITVEVGEQVEAGDILAYADVEAAEESLKNYQEQLDYENDTYELHCKISQTQQEQWAYQKQQADETEHIETSTEEEISATEETSATENEIIQEVDYDTQLAVEQENARYDAMLHEYRVKKLQKSIAELQEVIEDGTLVARHSGQVTYTKNIAKGREAGANENIVVVSDLDDICIELNNTNVQEYKFTDYEVKYITVGGEKVPVTEDEYSTEETILAKVNNRYPNVHIQCPETVTFTIGDNYPVYFIEKDVQNVLVVGNDSLYAEGDEHYVYVSSDSKEREKRAIEIGTSDDNYTQVTEGLVEGELVYYHSTARMPAEYTEYTVELSDFNIANHGIKFDRSDANTFPYLSDYEGEITEIAVSKEQKVTEGDLLYVIDTGEGKAAITAAQNAINQENKSYQQTLDSYEEQITAATENGTASYEIQILNEQKQLATLSHNYTLGKLLEDYNRISERNDGTGKISVYAPVSGTVSKVDISVGDMVEKDAQMLQITTQSTDILLVQMKESQTLTLYTDNIADVGETVRIKTENKTYDGTCIGWTVGSNNLEKGYVYTDEQGEVHLSYNVSSGYDYPAFYVKMNDASFFDNASSGSSVDFSYISMEKVVALPASMVYSETDQLNEKKVSYYVWRVADDELVKQYVLIDDSLKDAGKIVILSGIQPGDVLAQE